MKYRCRFRYVLYTKKLTTHLVHFVDFYNDNEYEHMKNTRNDDVSTQKFRSRTRCHSEILTSLVSSSTQLHTTSRVNTWVSKPFPIRITLTRITFHGMNGYFKPDWRQPLGQPFDPD